MLRDQSAATKLDRADLVIREVVPEVLDALVLNDLAGRGQDREDTDYLVVLVEHRHNDRVVLDLVDRSQAIKELRPGLELVRALL